MKQLNKIVFTLLTVVILAGCNQRISEGLQRKKFEFLYKLSNSASLFREYTGSLIYPPDIDFYENRMKKVHEDVKKIETIDVWGASKILKEQFLSAIDKNDETLKVLRLKNLTARTDLRKENEVRIMNEQVDKIIQALDEEITVVGKE